MNTPDQTIIELSRKKIALCVLGSCIFVAIGLWMVWPDDNLIQSMGGIAAIVVLYLESARLVRS
jgi:hypothetical protein